MTEEDYQITNRLGSRVMCFLMTHLPATNSKVKLTALGFHPVVREKVEQLSDRLSPVEMKNELRLTNPVALSSTEKDHEAIHKSPMSDQNYVRTWVTWKMNEALVSYYYTEFGFKPTTPNRDNFFSRDLWALQETIIAKGLLKRYELI